MFALVFIASPVWVYQFYFTVQWFEIVWALFLALCAGIYLIWLSAEAGSFAAGEALRRLAWMAGVFLAAFV
ncbi:MAG: hypothetical protein HFH34_16645 [Eubacterium sp.]|nr:hypothetical protein [Eubacterium sp.]